MATQELEVTERMRVLAYTMRRVIAPTATKLDGWADQLEAMADEVDALRTAFNYLRETADLNSVA